MIKVSRDWATPLVIGVFGLMAVTGVLMFFHANSHLQEEVHSWAGWVVVAAAVAHVAANWMGFKRYFSGVRVAVVALLGLSALVLAASFFNPAGGDEAAAPPAIAIRALTTSPLAQVAPLFHKSPEQAVAQLQAAGMARARADATLADLTAGDRGQVAKALQVLASAGAPGAH